MESVPDPDTALQVALLHNLASLEVARKQYRDAARRFDEALQLLDGGTPLPTRSAAQVLEDYAACLRKLGEGNQAKALEARVAEMLSGQLDTRPLTVDVTELARSR